MIIWLTGNTKAGKTTLAYLLKERIGGVILDGDEMRDSISLGATLSKDDRHEHNLRVARLARVLEQQGHNVIVSVIAPFISTRDEIDGICKPLWVYVKGGLTGKDKPYEPPSSPVVVVEPEEEYINQSLSKIIRGVLGQ